MARIVDRPLPVLLPALLVGLLAGCGPIEGADLDTTSAASFALRAPPPEEPEPIFDYPTQDPDADPPPASNLGRMEIAVTHGRSTGVSADETAWTGSPRDEVYLLVSRRINGTLSDNQYPAADDYYEFWDGTTDRWTNQSGKVVGAPTLAGPRYYNEGDRGTITVLVMEQDNNWFNETFVDWYLGWQEEIRDVVADAFEAAAALESVLELAGVHLPGINEHDRIGAFVVHFEVVQGRLVTTYAALDEATAITASPDGAARILMTGSGSEYQLDVVGRPL